MHRYGSNIHLCVGELSLNLKKLKQLAVYCTKETLIGECNQKSLLVIALIGIVL